MAFAVVFPIVMAIASTAISIIMKPKKKNSKAPAQDNSGLSVVTDGQSVNLPIVYGRALVGGVRVRVDVSDKMLAGPGVPCLQPVVNCNQSFHSVLPIFTSGTYTVTEYNEAGVLAPINLHWGFPRGGLMLDNWLDLDAYSFLFVQQALCVGPIKSARDVAIDDTGGSLELHYSTIMPEMDWAGRYEPDAAHMINVHYGYGVADSFSFNFNGINKSGSATFTGVAYASSYFRLSKTSPQFSGVPSLQFFIEGRLISKVIGGFLQETKVYSNNPVWCLLDYILDTVSGKGVHPEEIDLVSFESAALICDTIVQWQVPVGGRMNAPISGGGPNRILGVELRNLPLYECNISIDTSVAIRDNIEAILGTMGDARLVWSGGVYKLKLQYPIGLPGPITEVTITDEDIVIGEPLSLIWPTSSERLNRCTVRFSDEDLDFKENTVEWPPRDTVRIVREVGGFRMETGPAGADVALDTASSQAQALLQAVGVYYTPTYVSSGEGTVFFMRFSPPQEGAVLTVRVACAGAYDMSLTSLYALGLNSLNDYGHVGTPIGGYNEISMQVPPNIPVVEIMVGMRTNMGMPHRRGIFAFEVLNGANVLATSRGLFGNQVIINAATTSIYNQYLEEDGGLQMETEITANGTTDRYHALAQAEETVRTSRLTCRLCFTYTPYEFLIEPGDYFNVSSDILQIAMTFKANTVKVQSSGDCEVEAERFDISMLTWSDKSIEHSPALISETSGAVWSVASYEPSSYDSGRITLRRLHNYQYSPVVISYKRASSPYGEFTLIGSFYEYDNTYDILVENLEGTGPLVFSLSSSGWMGPNVTYIGSTGEGPPIPLIETISSANFVLAVTGSTVSWEPFTTYPSGSYSGGSAEYTSGTLYVYVLNGSVLTTTSETIAKTGATMGSYTPEGGLSYTLLKPPTNIRGTLGTSLSWDGVTGVTKYKVELLDGSTIRYTFTTSKTTYPFTTADIVKHFGSKVSSITVKVASLNERGQSSVAAAASVSAEVFAIPSGISVVQTAGSLSVRFTTEAPSVVVSVGSPGFSPEAQSAIKYSGVSKSPVTIVLNTTSTQMLRIAGMGSYTDKELQWSSECVIVATNPIPINIPLNSHTRGTVPFIVSRVYIPAGFYEGAECTIGCLDLGATATLFLEKPDGTLITSISHTGTPLNITSDAFTILEDTLVSLKLNCNIPLAYAFILGMVIR